MITHRTTQVALVAVMAVAGAGFLVGIDQGAPAGGASGGPGPAPGVARPPAEPGVAGDAVMPSATYRELRDLRVGANRGLVIAAKDLSAHAAPPEEREPVERKREALAARAERRAFHGAPPVIPHTAEPVASDACLSCHANSVRLAGKTADRVPHPYLTNCQQCHVAASPLFEPFVLAASAFRGLDSPTEGARAWDGAPPTIPHTTWMRDRCTSCHGADGKPGIRTSHPERVNCLQCHAPSAELDRIDIGPLRFLSSVTEAGTR